ncbi:ATP-binding cassette domain-containing protein [Intrasporangium sp.]|uniref:ABC transporter ATP-binding protein n=1 Tax=Intrasporangium sp. TaxID=1925024 RepID=UPI00293AB874|nr:ATP-binding cassette domain-containing protein [Intrasporangium sp.]MDV3220873.1 ATP-binding cassette domain-containing protein [Intrasporangium sp.]
MTATHSSAIILDGVTTGYVEGSPVLRDLSLRIPQTGLIRLHGPNGSGKSTVVEIASGYLRPWQGRVMVLDDDATSRHSRSRRRVVRTKPALFEYMTVHDHLAVFAKATGDSLARVLERATALGLDPWLSENAGGLSSGTGKKLWYLMCTTGDADLYLLDEPFNAIDDGGVEAIVDELTEWAAAGRCVVVICHTLPTRLRFDQVIGLGTHGVS